MSKEKSYIFERKSMEVLAQEHTILDVGGGERFGKWLAPHKDLFENCDYKTFDFDVSTGADVVGDIHSIPLADSSVDAVICSSVLEHVRDPHQAMREMTRILKKGGKLFFYMPSTYPYHARANHYPDYWRCFSDTLDLFFAGYTTVAVHKRGGYFLALSFFVPSQSRLRFILTPLAELLDSLFQTDKRNTTAGFYVLATK